MAIELKPSPDAYHERTGLTGTRRRKVSLGPHLSTNQMSFRRQLLPEYLSHSRLEEQFSIMS